MTPYLTPAALGYLTQLIMTALISGYFLALIYRKSQPRPAHLRWLTAFFLGLTAFIGALFAEAALPSSPRVYAVFLQIPLLAGSWLCLLQFIYRFPTLAPALRGEARAVGCISGLYTLWESG